jgi:uncharacterized OB-fold protein
MGVPHFPPRFETDLLRPFYDGLAQGELRLTAHPVTGAWLWYPPEITPGEPGVALDWRPVSPEGVIYTFTRVERSLLPGDHKAETPFTVVLFESDDAPGARVPGLYVAPADGREAACGQRVRLSPVRVGDQLIAGFTPVEGG